MAKEVNQERLNQRIKESSKESQKSFYKVIKHIMESKTVSKIGDIIAEDKLFMERKKQYFKNYRITDWRKTHNR